MLEINRQVVVFGNFNSVQFDSIVKLSELKEKYKFQTNAAPDIDIPFMPVIQNGQQLMAPDLRNNMRPIFQTEDKLTSVFFGASRIHVEQLKHDTEDFSTFNNMAMDIIYQVMEKLELCFTRLAVNGQILVADEKIMDKIYNDTFKESTLYGEKSDEWLLRIVSKDKDAKVNCDINRIISYERKNIIDAKGALQHVLIVGYDFNTHPGNNKVYNKEEIEKFNELGCKYRSTLL